MIQLEAYEGRTGVLGVARKAFEWLTKEGEGIPLIQGTAQYLNAKDFRSSPEGVSFLTSAYYIREATKKHGFRARSQVKVIHTEYGDTFTYPSIAYSIDLIPRNTKRGESPHRALSGIIKDLGNSLDLHEIAMEEAFFISPNGQDLTGEHIMRAMDAIRIEMVEGDI